MSALATLLLVALVWPLASHWPLSRLALLPWLLGLAAVPWIGVWLTACWTGDAAHIASWLRFAALGLLPVLASLGPLLRYFQDLFMHQGREGDFAADVFCASLGFGAMAWCASLLVGWAVRRWGSPIHAARALQLLLRGVPLLLIAGVVAVVESWRFPLPVESGSIAYAPDPVLECTLLAAVVWVLAWRGRRSLLQQMATWRAMPRVEVEAFANDAQWAEALDAAERHAMTALCLSLAFVGGVLFLQLVVMLPPLLGDG